MLSHAAVVVLEPISLYARKSARKRGTLRTACAQQPQFPAHLRRAKVGRRQNVLGVTNDGWVVHCVTLHEFLSGRRETTIADPMSVFRNLPFNIRSRRVVLAMGRCYCRRHTLRQRRCNHCFSEAAHSKSFMPNPPKTNTFGVN